MSDFLARVSAELDTSKAKSQLDTFTKGNHKIDVEVNFTSKNGNINTYLNQIQSQFRQAGSSAGANFSNAINSSLGKIDVNNAKSQVADLQRTLKSMNFDHSSIDKITSNLNEMDVAVEKVTTRLNGGNISVKVDGVDQMGRAVSVVKEFDSATGSIQRTSETVSFSVKKMFTEADVSKLNASLTSLDSGFSKLQGSSNKSSTEIQKLKESLNDIGSIKGLDNQQAEFQRISDRSKVLSSELKTLQSEYQKTASAQQLLSGKTVLGNQIETWMSRNKKAAQVYSAELEKLKSDLNAVTTNGELKVVANTFKEIKSSADATGVSGGWLSGLTQNLGTIFPMLSKAYLIRETINQMKEMVSTVVELDTALVDLQKTTTMNSSQLDSFYSSANGIAKEVGVTTKEIIEAGAEWSRLGYSSKEDVTQMSKLSSQFAAISPGMDTEQATTGLVSVIKAYGIETNDVLDGVMSKINIVGNTAATSNADIVEMLSKSSSAMAEGNNTLEETIALETAAFEVVQNASSVGNAFKTIAMRIRGYDEETESYTNDVEVLSGKIADFTKTAKTPGGISLFTDSSKTTYKSTYQIKRMSAYKEIYMLCA